MLDEWLQRFETEPFLGILAVVVAVLVLAIAVTLVWLVLRALWDARVTRLRDLFWSGLGRELVTVVGDDAKEADWLVRARTHMPAVLRACLNDYMIRTAGDYREGVARLYRGLGLLDGDLAELRSRRFGVRMRALRRLATVVTREHRAVIAAMASEGGEIRLLVAQIVGRIGTAHDVLALLASWRITSRLSEYPVHVMIDAMAAEPLREVMGHWDDLGQAELQRIVLTVGAKKVAGACQAILPRAAIHASIEVRIAAARACGSIASDVSLELLETLSADTAWEVRAQVAKALACHPIPRAAERLVAALSDKSFWVRQNAAFALGQHGQDGIRRLRAVAEQVGDRYARDAAEHVLTDLAIAHHEALPPAATHATAALAATAAAAAPGAAR